MVDKTVFNDLMYKSALCQRMIKIYTNSISNQKGIQNEVGNLTFKLTIISLG